ncbi:PepSY domain-containing protein [Amycolatopsis sp. K13G38]|uniref:PepSY domain-containing protein n=2 Tax=Amycolatopsis acididurans TaxID=2724524 RepID=A0ABX1JCG3_9PSEU|nr:PepSY domain-containing protein [Amycolatopsis acididurans]
MLAVRLLARRLHFMAGIVVAPFLLVLALTGLVYVFSPQIHDSLYHSALYVNGHQGKPHPVSEQVAAALAAHPEGSVRQVIPPPTPERTTRVVMSVPGLQKSGYGMQERTVFVDPYTDFISSELTTVDSKLPANTWLRDLHADFHLGEVGRVYAELGASWLPLIIIGGLVLWLAQPKRRKRVTAKELLLPSVSGAKDGWGRLRGVHGPLGLWLAIGMLLLALSGLLMSQFAGGRADRSIDPLRLHAPTLTAAPVPVPPGTAPIGIDEALAVARSAGLDGELVVTQPAKPGAVYTVRETSLGLPMHRDEVAINPYTSAVTEKIGWHDYSVPAKVSALATEFHTGTLFGLANQIVLTVIAVGLIALILLGYRMWWIKNPYKSTWSAVPPVSWRQLSSLPLALALIVVAALAWFMPVFGASLLVFVLADALINLIRRRRRPIPTPRAR